MQRYAQIISDTWKGRYVHVEDGTSTYADGIVDHFEWAVPSNIYTDPTAEPLFRCFLIPKFEEDADLYNANEDGFIVRDFVTKSFRIQELDENGDVKQSQSPLERI